MTGPTMLLGTVNSCFAVEVSGRFSSWTCLSHRSKTQLRSTDLSTNVYSVRARQGISQGLLLRSAFFSSCLKSSCVPKTTNAKKTAFRVVSEFPDDHDQETGVTTFLSNLQPRSQEAQSSSVRKELWSWNVFTMFDNIADHADALTEYGMRKRGVLYTADDWVRHRSSKRHLRHIASTFSSRVIISLIPPVTALTLIAVAVATYNTLIDMHVLPYYFPLVHTSAVPYQLTAPALALLLVFRTEASYSRYDEGRKTWTKVFASTKDFSRQCLAWIQHPDDSQRRMDLQHYIMAFPVALKCHVLDETDLYDDLKSLLDKEDLDLVMSSKHRPNCLLQLMTQTLGMLEISENQRNRMDAHISNFNESVSVCERILRSPIPLSYTRLTSRALVLWHLTLPVVLWDDCKWMVIFATFFSSCTLFCIEQVGVLIEEPFPMLSLDKMCSVAHQSVQELVVLQRVTDSHLRAKSKELSSSASSGAGSYGRVYSNGQPPNSRN